MKKQDADIKKMTEGQAKRELQRVRDLVRTHRSADENARCWLRDVALYEKILPEVKPAGRMDLSLDELLANCRVYILGQKRR